jgi:hypothetical protein
MRDFDLCDSGRRPERTGRRRSRRSWGQIAERARVAPATLVAAARAFRRRDTYRRVLQRLRPEAFQRCFETWFCSRWWECTIKSLRLYELGLRN